MDDLTKLDLYSLLGVEEGCSESAIKKAFRVKALTCHPDKHPDDPKAAQQFHQIRQAAEVLLDGPAREAYDRLLKNRKERHARSRGLDSVRKKLKEELEERERASREPLVRSALDDAARLAQEVERLRRQGCQQLDHENETLRQEIRQQQQQEQQRMAESESPTAGDARLKVSWKSAAGVQPDRVKALFQRFGHVQDFILSSKGSSALIVFKEPQAIVSATTSALTAGFTMDVLSPLSVTKNLTASSLQKRSENYEQLVLDKLRQKAQELKQAGARS